MIDTIDIIIQGQPAIIEIVNQRNVPVIDVITYKGLPGAQGPPGTGSSLTELPLTVETTGQTEFNIFSFPDPAQITELIVNGVEYFENEDYDFQTIAGNVKLIWFNEFLLTTTDVLKFKKY